MHRLVWIPCAVLFCLSASALELDTDLPSKDKLDSWIELIVRGEDFDEAFDKLKSKWIPPTLLIELRKRQGGLDPAALIRLNRLNDSSNQQRRIHTLTNAVWGPDTIEYEIEAHLEFGGQKFQTSGRGAFLKDGAKFRLESISIQNGLKRRILHLSDGNKVYREYSVLDADGKPTSIHVESTDHAEVAKLQQIPQNELYAEVLRATKAFDFYTLSEEFLGPKSVDVLKGVERGARSIPVENAKTTLRLTLRPKDSMLIRSEEKGPQGSHDIHYKNIKINEPIDDALFIYKPPEGVPVKDLSAERKARPK